MLFEPVYILQALNTGTCLQQGDLFYSISFCGPQPTQEKSGEVFGKKIAGEWTGRAKISEEEIPGGKRSMYGYIPTYSRL